MIRSFFQNAVILFAIELVVRVKAIVLIPLLTHHLDAAEFGLWSQVAVLVAVLSPMVTLGTDIGVLRYLPGIPSAEARARYTGWYVLIMASAVVFALLLYLLRNFVASSFFGDDPALVPFVALAAMSLVVMISQNSLRLWLRVTNRARAYGMVAAIQAIIGLFAVAAAVFYKSDPYDIIVWPLMGDVLLCLGLVLQYRKELVWVKPSWSGFRRISTFGLAVLPGGLAVWGLNYIDRVFLIRYASLADVGVYALTFSVASIVIQFATGPIWSMYYSSAAELHNSGRSYDLQRLFDRSIEAICLVTAPLVAAMAFFGRDLLSLLAPQSYLYGAPIMAVIALGYVLMMLSSYFETSLALHERPRVGTCAAIVALAVKGLLNFLLVERWGIWGAAASSIAAFAVQVMITLWACIKAKYLVISPRYGVLAYLYAFLAYAVIWIAYSIFFPGHGILLSIGGVCLGGAIYAFAMIFAGGLHPDVARWVSSGGWKTLVAFRRSK